MRNNTTKLNSQMSQNANCRIWIVPESKIKTEDETPEPQWGYDDWEIYHG